MIERKKLIQHIQDECDFTYIECPLANLCDCKEYFPRGNINIHFSKLRDEHVQKLLGKSSLITVDNFDSIAPRLFAILKDEHTSKFVIKLLQIFIGHYDKQFAKFLADHFIKTGNDVSTVLKKSNCEIDIFENELFKLISTEYFKSGYFSEALTFPKGFFNISHITLSTSKVLVHLCNSVEALKSVIYSKSFNKLTCMINDAKESITMSSTFEKKDFNIILCYEDIWPNGSAKFSDVKIPGISIVKTRCEEYRKFHSAKYPKGSLTYDFSLGSAEVEMNFEKGKQTFLVTTYQMMILSLFSKSRSIITFEEIAYEILGNKYAHRCEVLKSHLLSLTKPSVGILVLIRDKELDDINNTIINGVINTNAIDFNDWDKFTVNSEYVPTSKDIIQVPLLKYDFKKRFDTRRMIRIECAIIREMKVKQALTEGYLKSAVSSALSHIHHAGSAYNKSIMDNSEVSNSEFTTVINKLIDEKYIKRDEHNPKLIRYL